MTIKEAIESADVLQNNNFSRDIKIKWLSELEEKIMNEVYATHETLNLQEMKDWVLYIRDLFVALYTNDEEQQEELEQKVDENTELLIPLQFHNVYTNYLLTRYAMHSGEYERASIFETHFMSEYQEFCNYINRNYKPLQNNKIGVS